MLASYIISLLPPFVKPCQSTLILTLLACALQGELSEPVKTEDCMWNMEGGVVDITLQKQDGMHWWSCVIKVLFFCLIWKQSAQMSAEYITLLLCNTLQLFMLELSLRVPYTTAHMFKQPKLLLPSHVMRASFPIQLLANAG